MLSQQTTEAGATVLNKTATAATYGGSAGAAMSGLASDAVFGLTTSQWSVIGVIGGLVIALLGFAVNFYFKQQHLLIARQVAKASEDE